MNSIASRALIACPICGKAWEDHTADDCPHGRKPLPEPPAPPQEAVITDKERLDYSETNKPMHINYWQDKWDYRGDKFATLRAAIDAAIKASKAVAK